MPNSLYDNSTDAIVVKILQSNANYSDSMVFGLNSENNANNKLVSEKSNPFFEDTVGFGTIEGADNTNSILAVNLLESTASNSIDGDANLTMVILKVSY